MSLDRERQEMLEAVVGLASQMPGEFVRQLAAGLRNSDSETAPSIPNPNYRALAAVFVESWRKNWPQISPGDVSVALETAAYAEASHQQQQQLELVWTGPDTKVLPVRRTEQVLLQVIDSATEKLTLVSYAVYKIPHICQALLRAANRGVSLRIIVENPDRQAGQEAYDTLRAFGDIVAARSSVYLWPLSRREKDGAGRHGILHVKCAVADNRWLFISSANLTEYAFTVNMELGVLISGGALPAHVEAHFDQLIASGAFTRL